MLSLSLLLWSPPPMAGDEETQVPVLAEESQLDAALASYLDGDLPAARDALLRIVNDEATGTELLHEARVWLGEVQYYLDEKDAARSTFRTVLLYRRDYRMDPFVHPPEVVAFFDSVRAEVEAVGPGPRPLPDRPPLHAYLWPGGLQLHNGRPGAAALTAVSVTGTVVVVGGARVYLLSQDQDPDTPGIDVRTENKQNQLEAVRAAQFGVAAVGTTIWLGTTVGGTLRAVRPTAYPGGVGLSITW